MDGDNQKNTKTIISFVAGLVIGGLLVWVFISAPSKETLQVNDTKDETTKTVPTTEKTKTTESNSTEDEPVVAVTQVGAGSIVALNQKAGKTVTLGEVKYPVDTGWLAVHELVGDTPGIVLGAARFGVKEGLMPKVIELIRGTVAGKEYRVVFHESNGDREYASAVDAIINGTDGKSLGTTFKAE